MPRSDLYAKYADLIAKGAIRFGSKTTSDLDSLPRVEVPPDVDPLQVLLELRELDGDR